jgi:hypothetical protein
VEGLPDFTSVASSLISPSAVEAEGLETMTVGWLLLSDAPIPTELRLALRDELEDSAVVEFRDAPQSTSGARSAGVTGAALIAAAILMSAVSLVAVESEQDLRLLSAVGAGNRTLRAFNGASAVQLSLAGAILALIVGVLVQAALLVVPDAGFTIAAPVTSLAIVVVGLPLLAGVLAVALGRRSDYARSPR